MKRVFGKVEAIFDIFYLAVATCLGFTLLLSAMNDTARMLAGIAALVLVMGDAFHLVPRIILIFLSNKEEQLQRALGFGKLITSITMTLFYLLLWQFGLYVYSPMNINIWSYIIYILVVLRTLLCLLPQNEWQERHPPLSWGIWRNIPFFILGFIVAGLFFQYRDVLPELHLLWFAIVISFTFYLPVVLWSNKNPKIGMLMLPKTCAYLWILTMFLTL